MSSMFLPVHPCSGATVGQISCRLFQPPVVRAAVAQHDVCVLLRDLKDFGAVRAVPSSEGTREEKRRQRNKTPGERERALGRHIQ